MKLVDKDENELFDLGDLEPWLYSVVGSDLRLHPVVRLVYKPSSIEIEWAKDDKATLLGKLQGD